MRTSHFMAICLLVGLLCGIPHAEAGQSRVIKDFSGSLQRLQSLLYDIRTNSTEDAPLSVEIGALQSLLTELQTDYLLVNERFRLQGAAIAASGSVQATARHAVMNERYQLLVNELLALLERLAIQGAAGHAELERALDLLDQLLPQRDLPLHGALPYRSLEPVDIAPVMFPEVVPAYRRSDVVAVDDDLASAPEAPVSAAISMQAREIANQAGKLNWDPLDLYEWVKNNIATEWYHGCMKGAEETLRQRSGNNADQAALLIALLRAAGYPSRYVRGVIAFSPGLEQLEAQTGIHDPVRLVDFLRKAGIPCEPVLVDEEIVNVRVEHVWVETLVPYANYRGSLGDTNGRIWLPLDTSFKVAGFTETGWLDLYAQADNPFHGLVDDYLAAGRVLTPLETLQEASGACLVDNELPFSYADLLHARHQVPEAAGILPATLPFLETVVTGEYAALPPELVHKVTISIDEEQPVLDVSLPVHEVANRRLVIGFEPENVADHETINLWGGLDNTPAYLVRLRPVLEVDGVRRAVGRAGFTVGAMFDLAIALHSPARVQTVTNRVVTGYPLLLGLVAQQPVPLETTVSPETATGLLHGAVLDYIDRWTRAEQELAELLDLHISRPMPTLVTMGGQLEVTALFGEPQEIELRGLFIDADLRSVAAAQRHTGEDDRMQVFMQLSALQGSVLEARLFEDHFGLPGISTAGLFGLAGDAGIPVAGIEASNLESWLAELALPDTIAADVAEATTRGWTVRMPVQRISYLDWSGFGYLKEDPLTGAAGYMLSGMTAGGATATRTEAWSDLLRYLFRHPLSLTPNHDPDAACSIRKIVDTDLQTGTVGQPFHKPLTVYVSDSEGVPVRNASVIFTVKDGGGLLRNAVADPPVEGATLIVPTDWRGLAGVILVAGERTEDNRVSWHATGDTYASWGSQQTVRATLANGTAAEPPFMATALPDVPQALMALTPGVTGDILQYGGKIGVLLEDRYGNPVANVPVDFNSLKATSHSGLCDPAGIDPSMLAVQLTASPGCIAALPSWGDCAEDDEATSLTMSNGVAAVGVVMGGFPDGAYPVVASGRGLAAPLEKVTFHNVSLPFAEGSGCGASVPPLSYFTLQPEEFRVRPANRPVTLRVRTQLYAEGRSSETGLENLSCSGDTQVCPQIAGDGRVRRVTPQTLQVAIATREASRSAEVADLYETQVTLALGEQSVPVSARATRSIELFDNNCVEAGGCAPLPTLQNKEYLADWQVSYTGVAVGGLPDVLPLAVDANGLLMQDIAFDFDILPAGYDAVSSSFLLYQDGWLVMSVPTATMGSPSVTLSRGLRLDPSSHYEAAVVLNYGWGDAEIWSQRVPVLSEDFAVRVGSVAGNWLSASELEKTGAFVLLNNDLEASAKPADDDEMKPVELVLPVINGATQGSWSVSVSDPQRLVIFQQDGTPLVPGQSQQVTLPAVVHLYLEGRAESEGLKSDFFTVRFTAEGDAAMEKMVPVSVVNLDMAVDGNRDRVIKIQDPEDESYLFWVNNDYDDNTCVDVQTTPEICEEDDLDTELEDARDNRIRTRRDLEDFARLHLFFGGSPAFDALTWTVRTEALPGNAPPLINLFRAVDGSDKYLGFDLGPDDRHPDLQLLEQRLVLVGTGESTLAADWLAAADGISPFLFEGLEPGRGDLVLTGHHLGVPVAERRVRLELRDVTWFYDHYLLPASGETLHPVASRLGTVREGGYMPATDEYVLFVHGWDMEGWQKRRWAETLFKRLWWHGYQGGVGLFDWPCRTMPSLDFQVNFDHSEYRAWHSAAVLADLLTDRDRPTGGRYAGKVRLLAHSQGNVVAGEAINLMPAGAVHSYVASQAALSASFYHQDIMDFDPQLSPYTLETPDVFGFYPESQPALPYLYQVPQKVPDGALYSYFNRDDYALTDANELWPAWEFNNRTRPDNTIGYYYRGDTELYPNPTLPGEGFVHLTYGPDPWTGETQTFERALGFPADRYEIFAYGGESRSKALGAILPPPEFSEDSKDLADFGYDKEHYSHSRQFRSNIVDEMEYWRAFADDAKLTLINSIQELQ